jgi:hypothetical protein
MYREQYYEKESATMGESFRSARISVADEDRLVV